MTDKELLELAAKAAGIDAYWSVDGSIQRHEIFVTVAGGSHGTMPYESEWNPLKSDSDALRLAVKLGLCVDISIGFDTTTVDYFVNEDTSLCEAHHSDPLAATRRAIVRAAAAIGDKL